MPPNQNSEDGQAVPGHVALDRDVRQDGPVLTDQNGNLPAPILMCAYDEHRCKHLGVHDWHYFYCAAQDAPNKHAGPREYAYPWRGAGKRLRDYKPDSGCPFLTPNTQLTGLRPKGATNDN